MRKFKILTIALFLVVNIFAQDNTEQTADSIVNEIDYFADAESITRGSNQMLSGNLIVNGYNRGVIFDTDNTNDVNLMTGPRIGYQYNANNAYKSLDITSGMGVDGNWLRFGIGNSQSWHAKMFLKPNGFLGIGMEDPMAKLHIGDGCIRIDNKGVNRTILEAPGWSGTYKVAIQDGNGRIVQTWNALAQKSNDNRFYHTYEKSNEGSNKLVMGAGEFKFYSAQAGEEDSEIEWNESISINSTGNVIVGEAGNNSDMLYINGNSHSKGNIKINEPGNLRIWTIGAGREDGIHADDDGKDGYPEQGEIINQTMHSFAIRDNWQNKDRLFIDGQGNVGIGTHNTGNTKLTVEGDIALSGSIVSQNSIECKHVKVSTAPGGPDYVFEKEYNLKPLVEVESFIKENKHLPEIPSAKEMEKSGIDLVEMNFKLLQKIEELTLHTINQDKNLKELQNIIERNGLR